MTNAEHTNYLMHLIQNRAENEIMRQKILDALQETYRRGADSIRNSRDYHQSEDMGR